MWGNGDMKKFLSLLILPLVAVMCLFGCGDDRTVADIKKLYLETVAEHKVEDTKVFFSDTTDELMLCISYPETLKNAITETSPSTDVMKRFKGLGYQQKILNYIFKYYSNHQEDFYRIAGSKNIEKNELNGLYDKLTTLNKTLDDFWNHYNAFIDAIDNGISNIMKYNITRYTYQLNQVIDVSFDFVYSFHNMYSRYCVENYNQYSQDSLNAYVDKAYLDIAYVVYYENIKAFNNSESENGVCDLSAVVNNSSEYNILSLLDSRKGLDVTILDNLTEGSSGYVETMEKLNDFSYSRNLFDQKLTSYKTTYRSLDIYTITSYRFEKIGGVDYEDYINTLSPSKKATVLMLDNFVNYTFDSYVEKLNELVN